jgi:hypothetical protein
VPVELLGSVYERFLGSTIAIERGKAKVIEKPEVRHAGGVYYTPSFIVDAIVLRTLGPLLDKKTPEQMIGLRVIDPACGSGSFLLAAFQLLVERHEAFYRSVQKQPGKHKADFVVRDGVPRLTLRRKQAILTHCLYGVDLDAQAVEVAQMSLYLKLLEGERDDTLSPQLDLRATYLPPMMRNIRRGNSLISSQDLDPQADWTRDASLHPFDWASPSEGFGEVMDRGGFDAVIGNPPYVRIQELKQWAPREAEVYKRKFLAAGKGNFDLYVVFIEQALRIANKEGRVGFIVPNKFIGNDYGGPLRKLLASGRHLIDLVDFRHHQVFENVSTYTCLLFLGRGGQRHFTATTAIPKDLDRPEESFDVDSATLSEEPWLLLSPADTRIWEKLHSATASLSDLGVAINRGSSTGDDDVFVVTSTPQGWLTHDGSTVAFEEGILRTPLWADSFGRYAFKPSADRRVIFPYLPTRGHLLPIAEDDLKRKFPRAYRYLSAQRARLTKRKQFREWYAYSAPRSLDGHDAADFLIPLLAIRGSVAAFPHSNGPSYCLLASGGFSMTLPAEHRDSVPAVLAVLNSDVCFWVLRKRSSDFRGGWLTCTKQFVELLPIPDDVLKPTPLRVALTDLAGRAAVERAALGSESSYAFRTPAEMAIDRLLSEHAGLTEDEFVRIVSITRFGGKKSSEATEVSGIDRLRSYFGPWEGPAPNYTEIAEARAGLWSSDDEEHGPRG